SPLHRLADKAEVLHRPVMQGEVIAPPTRLNRMHACHSAEPLSGVNLCQVLFVAKPGPITHQSRSATSRLIPHEGLNRPRPRISSSWRPRELVERTRSRSSA